MGAGEVVCAVESGEVGGGEGGDEVCAQGGGGGCAEGAADDLLDGAGVEVDAGAEAGHGACRFWVCVVWGSQ